VQVTLSLLRKISSLSIERIKKKQKEITIRLVSVINCRKMEKLILRERI
jgi:hypothetical protein